MNDASKTLKVLYIVRIFPITVMSSEPKGNRKPQRYKFILCKLTLNERFGPFISLRIRMIFVHLCFKFNIVTFSIKYIIKADLNVVVICFVLYFKSKIAQVFKVLN